MKNKILNKAKKAAIGTAFGMAATTAGMMAVAQSNNLQSNNKNNLEENTLKLSFFTKMLNLDLNQMMKGILSQQGGKTFADVQNIKSQIFDKLLELINKGESKKLFATTNDIRRWIDLIVNTNDQSISFDFVDEFWKGLNLSKKLIEDFIEKPSIDIQQELEAKKISSSYFKNITSYQHLTAKIAKQLHIPIITWLAQKMASGTIKYKSQFSKINNKNEGVLDVTFAFFDSKGTNEIHSFTKQIKITNAYNWLNKITAQNDKNTAESTLFKKPQFSDGQYFSLPKYIGTNPANHKYIFTYPIFHINLLENIEYSILPKWSYKMKIKLIEVAAADKEHQFDLDMIKKTVTSEKNIQSQSDLEISFFNNTSSQEINQKIQNSLKGKNFHDSAGRPITLITKWVPSRENFDLRLSYKVSENDKGNNSFIIKYEIDQTVYEGDHQTDNNAPIIINKLKTFYDDASSNHNSLEQALKSIPSNQWQNFLLDKKSWAIDVKKSDVIDELKKIPSLKQFASDSHVFFKEDDITLEVDQNDPAKLKIVFNLKTGPFTIEINGFKGKDFLLWEMENLTYEDWALYSQKLPSEIDKKVIVKILKGHLLYVLQARNFNWNATYLKNSISEEAITRLVANDHEGTLSVTINLANQNFTLVYRDFSTNDMFNKKAKIIVLDKTHIRTNPGQDIYYEDLFKIIKHEDYFKEFKVDLIKNIANDNDSLQVFKIIVRKAKNTFSDYKLTLDQIRQKSEEENLEDFQVFYITLDPSLGDHEISSDNLLLSVNKTNSWKLRPVFKWEKNADGLWSLKLYYVSSLFNQGRFENSIFEYVVKKATKQNVVEDLLEVNLLKSNIKSLFGQRKHYLASSFVDQKWVKAEMIERIKKSIKNTNHFKFNQAIINQFYNDLENKENNMLELSADDKMGIITVKIHLNKDSSDQIIEFKISGFKLSKTMMNELVVASIGTLDDEAIGSKAKVFDFEKTASHSSNQNEANKQKIITKINQIISNDIHYPDHIKKLALPLLKKSDVSFSTNDEAGTITVKIDSIKFGGEKHSYIVINGFATNNKIVANAIQKLEKSDFAALNKQIRPSFITAEHILDILKNDQTGILKNLTNAQKKLLDKDDISLFSNNKDGVVIISISHHGNDKKIEIHDFIKTIDIAKSNLAKLISRISNESFDSITFEKNRHASDQSNYNPGIKKKIKDIIIQMIQKQKIDSSAKEDEKNIIKNIKISFEHNDDNGTLSIFIDTTNLRTGASPHEVVMNGFLTNDQFLKTVIDSLKQEEFDNNLSKMTLPSKVEVQDVFAILSNLLDAKSNKFYSQLLTAKDLTLIPNNTDGSLSIVVSHHGQEKVFKTDGFKKISEVATKKAENLVTKLTHEIFEKIDFAKGNSSSHPTNQSQKIKEQIILIIKKRIEHLISEEDVQRYAKKLFKKSLISFDADDQNGTLIISIDTGELVPGLSPPKILLSGFLSNKEVVKKAVSELSLDKIGDHLNKQALPNSFKASTVLKKLKEVVFNKLSEEQKQLLDENDITLNPNNNDGTLEILINHHGESQNLKISGFKSLDKIAHSHLEDLLSHLSSDDFKDIKFRKELFADDSFNKNLLNEEDVVNIIKQKIENHMDDISPEIQKQIEVKEKALIKPDNIQITVDNNNGTLKVSIDLSEKTGSKSHDIILGRFLTELKVVEQEVQKLAKEVIANAFDKKVLPSSYGVEDITKIFREEILKNLSEKQKLLFSSKDIAVIPSDEKGTLEINVNHHGEPKNFVVKGFIKTKDLAQLLANNVVDNIKDDMFEGVHFDKGKYASDAFNQSQQIVKKIIDLLKIQAENHDNKKVVTAAKDILSKKHVKFKAENKTGKLEIAITNRAVSPNPQYKHVVTNFLTDEKVLIATILDLENIHLVQNLEQSEKTIASLVKKETILAGLKSIDKIRKLPAHVQKLLSEDNISLKAHDEQGELIVLVHHLGKTQKFFSIPTLKADESTAAKEIVVNNASGNNIWKYLLIGVVSFVGVVSFAFVAMKHPKKKKVKK